jgi:hypothetical protein
MDAENLAPNGIQSPDHPARSESLYILSYPSRHTSMYYIKQTVDMDLAESAAACKNYEMPVRPGQ